MPDVNCAQTSRPLDGADRAMQWTWPQWKIQTVWQCDRGHGVGNVIASPWHLLLSPKWIFNRLPAAHGESKRTKLCWAHCEQIVARLSFLRAQERSKKYMRSYNLPQSLPVPQSLSANKANFDCRTRPCSNGVIDSVCAVASCLRVRSRKGKCSSS